MEKRYAGRNVDLSLLGEWIERFFRRRKFKMLREKRIEAYRIIALPTYMHEIVDEVTVSVSGDPHDFRLRFTVGARSDVYVKIGLLTQLFGGGIFFLRGAKSQEAEEELERSFWTYIEEKIDFLAGKGGGRS